MVLPLGGPKRSPGSLTARRTLYRSTSSNSTLTEALRTNPFRFGSTESLTFDATDEDVNELNGYLVTLADLFPDVQVEVVRELLLRFDGDSRLEISAEQLFKHKAEWAKGRYTVPPRDLGERPHDKELFKSRKYMAAAKKTLCLEFGTLSKSAVDGVLAEVNSSYSQARPVLRDLASKSWRTTLSNLFRKKKPQEEVPACLFENRKGDNKSQLRKTGSVDLDDELAQLFLKPLLEKDSKIAEISDFEFAQALNQREAERVDALFECQCCYNDVTFENMSACTTSSHVICFDCIRRTVHEVLFGQGWAKSIDPGRETLKCIAPLADGDCDGSLTRALVQRAVISSKSGEETWSKYEERATFEALQKSQLKVVSCPFCSYAEADHVYDGQTCRKLRWRFRKNNAMVTSFLFILFLNLIPLFLLILLPLSLFASRYEKDLFYNSLGNIALRRRPTRFRCQNPSCKRTSCLKCQKAWHDPHTCHEPLLLSLRTTVEAARTTAIKRTCPRCGTSFVKSSGCNKLTCTCGYAMCYICRKNIGRSGEDGNGEGYMHFCEHFRPNPGQPCTECQKCDLYQAEDEDLVAKKAGEEAERQWRIREGMMGVAGLEEAIENSGAKESTWSSFWNGNWTIQSVSDWAVFKVVVVEE